MKAKRTLSALLTLLMLVSVVASLPFTVHAADGTAATTVTSTNPAIFANVGDTIDLTKISVQTDAGQTLAAGSITWKNGGNTITSLKPDKKGVTPLTATSGSTSKNVYVVAKNANEDEYVLYENDFSKDNLAADGWKALNVSYKVADGELTVDSKNTEIGRINLPEWLGDFGDYEISASMKQTDNMNDSRWCSIVYRAENANGNYYPFYHMCVRVNAASPVEFAERTASNGWNVINVITYSVNLKNAFHELTVRAFGNTVEYLIDNDSVFYTTEAKAHTKGYPGFAANYGILHVDSVKVTALQEAPKAPAVAPKLVDTSGNRPATNITSYVSNQAYAKDEAAFDALIAAKDHPVAILLDVDSSVTAAKFATYLKACADKGIIPEFRLSTEAQVKALGEALDSTRVPEAMVISSDAAVVKAARALKPTVIRASLELTEDSMTKEQLFAAYQKAAGANAQGVVLPYALATKENVAYLQSYSLSVWALGTGVDTNTEAAWLLASGANAVLSDNWALVAEAETKIFTANNSLTRTPVYTAHRGYWVNAPENSMAAYIAAYESGVDNIETDVHVSKDGVVFVCHDDNIDRTTNGKGYIRNMTYEELKSYNLRQGAGGSTAVTDEKLPTFEELLQYFQGKDIKIFCELKENQNNLPAKTAELVKKYGMEDQVIFISFYGNQINLIKQELNTCGDLLGGTVAASSDTLGTLNGYYALQASALTYNATLGPSYGNVTAEYVRDASDRGMTFWTWTYDTGSRTTVQQMFLNGMNGLTTNDAPYLRNTVKTILAPDTVYAEAGGDLTLKVRSRTYRGTLTNISDDVTYIALDNDGVLTINGDGTVTANKAGEATVLAAYETNLPNGTKYTLYTQPITVKVEGELAELTLNDDAYTLSSNEKVGDLLNGVAEMTSVSELLSSVANAQEVKIYNQNGEEVTNTATYLGNGYTIKYKDTETTVVVLGDIAGDGKVTAFDYMLAKRYVLGTFGLSDVQQLAADVTDADNTSAGSRNGVSAIDYMFIKRHVTGTMNLYG